MSTDSLRTRYPDLDLTLAEAGQGRPCLILHGGGGAATVAGLAEHLARTHRVLLPTHPGWDGTPGPSWLTGVDDLALLYLHLLHARGLTDVLVVGSSLGGWTAAELAVRDTAGLVTGLVLINAIGVEVETEPVADIFALDARGLAELTWHDPDRFAPLSLPPEQLAVRTANLAASQRMAGERPYDPKLRRRLGRVSAPTLLLWGESDGIVTPAYGAAYAEAFADGRLRVVPEAGHLPHVERPAATFALLDEHLREQAG